MDNFSYGDLSGLVLEHNGTAMTMKQWAEHLGVPYATVRVRYKRGKRNFSDLFRHVGIAGKVDVTTAGKALVQHRTILDDIFKDSTVDDLRELARAMGETPITVMTKIVEKYAADLRAKHCNHADQ